MSYRLIPGSLTRSCWFRGTIETASHNMSVQIHPLIGGEATGSKILLDHEEKLLDRLTQREEPKHE